MHEQDYEEALGLYQQNSLACNMPIVPKPYSEAILAYIAPACLHADNVLDADSSVGLTSGYGGDTYDAAWVQDPDVGTVIECNKVCLLLRRCTHDEVPLAALCDSPMLPFAAGYQSRIMFWAVRHASVPA